MDLKTVMVLRKLDVRSFWLTIRRTVVPVEMPAMILSFEFVLREPVVVDAEMVSMIQVKSSTAQMIINTQLRVEMDSAMRMLKIIQTVLKTVLLPVEMEAVIKETARPQIIVVNAGILQEL